MKEHYNENLDIHDLHYLLNLIHTIFKEPILKARFKEDEFSPDNNRSNLYRVRYKLQNLLHSYKRKPLILPKPIARKR